MTRENVRAKTHSFMQPASKTQLAKLTTPWFFLIPPLHRTCLHPDPCTFSYVGDLLKVGPSPDIPCTTSTKKIKKNLRPTLSKTKFHSKMKECTSEAQEVLSRAYPASVYVNMMKVIVQDLKNKPQFNGCSGRVFAMDSDSRLHVSLDVGGKCLLLKRDNLRHVLVAGNGLSYAHILEFFEGTPRVQISDRVQQYRQLTNDVAGSQKEVVVLLRPSDAASVYEMNDPMKACMVSAARLEHMGQLSKTAELFGWVESCVDGVVVYKNDSLRCAMVSTRELYLHPMRISSENVAEEFNNNIYVQGGINRNACKDFSVAGA